LGITCVIAWFRQLAIFAPEWYTLVRGRKLKTMADSASYSTEVQTSGGFRLEVSPDELTVTKLTPGLWICLIFGLVSLWFCSALGAPVLLLGLAVLVLGYFFVRVRNLRCTREYLKVIDVFAWPRETRTMSYKRGDVRDIRLGVVAYARYSIPITGLVFNVGDKRIKTLYGLRGREAQKIFDELQRLGFHISYVPAMR
jgi:hypothetical protein